MTEPDFSRLLHSLVGHELATARKVSVLSEPILSLGPTSELSEHGLGIDSLELLRIAGAVNEFFHLHEYSVQDYLLHHRSLSHWAQVVQTVWRDGLERLTFRTSGSTGGAKACEHERWRLDREVAEHAQRFRDVRRIFTAVPAHHIYGFLFTVLLPSHLGADVVDVRGWSPGRLRQELQTSDLLVASPTFWEYWSRSLDTFGPGVSGVTSSAPCPPELLTQLIAQGAQMTEVYGSTETAGVAVRTHPAQPFTLLSYWQRDPTDPPTLLHGLGRDGSRDPVHVMDEIEWLSDRTFRLQGRRDGAVQVAGYNVYPQAVAACMAGHPDVAACEVRLMRPDEGDRLKAFVVWRESQQAANAEEALRTWCRQRLRPAECPGSITSGERLPRNEYGKAQDWHAIVP